ncbi:MAG: hypothetical protein KGO81_14510 [Bacteroidota bacterium]|nr:hypothetical protein [Bacteroidota bacterium]
MKQLRAISLLIFLFSILHCTAQKVSFSETGNNITINNSIVSFTFNKSNADLTEIRNWHNTNLLGKKGRAYLLGPGFSMFPCTFNIVRSNDSLIELSFYHEASNHFQYDLHYLLRKGDAGIYCFLEQTHKASDSAGNYGQTRWGVRADESLFDYHLVRDSLQGPMPALKELTDGVQDWTYKLNDSTYYTKYDYADYIEGRHVHGMAGQKSGLGLFVIQASHEYLNGGPTKQYQNVHATPFLICMFNCGHFLSDRRKADNIITGNWKKLSGPFFLYINEGKNINDIWNDAKAKATEEVGKWPYVWMEHNDYSLRRGTVSGKLLIDNKPAQAGTHLILAAPGYDWQAQSQGYIYYCTTDENGLFQMSNIRSGNYTLYAYGSNETEEFSKSNIHVKAGVTTILGKLQWQPVRYGKQLWQIGIADRKTTGFALSNHKRNYSVFKMPPANLTYTIGKSKESDWYYAQTKPGTWTIEFNNIETFNDSATLTLAFAGYARNPTLIVTVNDTQVASVTGGNDASVYRSAVAGGYYQLQRITFPSTLLLKGNNHIDLTIQSMKEGAGIMYDAIKLEAR